MMEGERTRQTPVPGRFDQAVDIAKELVLRHSSLVVVVVLVVLATVLSNGVFIRPSNLVTFLYQSAIVGVLAIGQGLVIISRGLDLSVGVVAILTAILIGGISSTESDVLPHLGVMLAFAIGLGVATLIGALNGLAVARTRIPPFIVTLAMLLMVSGLAYQATDGAPIYNPAEVFEDFGQRKLWLLPYPLLTWFVLVILGQLFLSRTKAGVLIYAVGGNEQAARLAGLPVGKTKVLVYTLSGLMAGIAGFLFLSRTGYAEPSAGGDYMLDSIAAVAVGGVSLAGGRGSLKDVLLGVLILAILGNVMNILLISPYLQATVRGTIILLAVMVNLRLAQTR